MGRQAPNSPRAPAAQFAQSQKAHVYAPARLSESRWCLWDRLSPDSKDCLDAYQRKRHRRRLGITMLSTPPVQVRGVLESTEQIGKLMALPPRSHLLREE